MKLSILIPAHNEEKTITAVLEKTAGVNITPWEKEIIVVDDGSSDRTGELVSKWQISNGQLHTNFIQHPHNLGKGAAIKTALEKVTGDYIIIQDADLEYEPSDIPNLLSFISDTGRNRVAVFGDRGTKSYPERGFHYVLGAKLLTWSFNILFGVWVHDLYTGYKLIPANAIKSFNLQSRGFEFEAEVAAKILKAGLKIKEAPIQYHPRNKDRGKHIRAKDAFVGLWTILKFRVK